MDDGGERSWPTRREVLGATAGALAVGALPGRSGAQQASGPTVYVGSFDNTLYAVDAATGEQEWAFTQPSAAVRSSPTVVADPESGDSVGSRVMLGTLGHHGHWRYADGSILGTTEMAAVGGGGTLALLFGAYALMRRGDDAGDDSTPERPSEPDTPGRATTDSPGPQSPGSDARESIDDLLDDVARALDSARQSADAGDYDRALKRCREATDTAEQARRMAEADAPDRLEDVEAVLDDTRVLRERIESARQPRRSGRPPETVPRPPNLTLTYDDIAQSERDNIGQGDGV